MSPARNSAQPSGVAVSAGSASETRTSTVSPVDVDDRAAAKRRRRARETSRVEGRGGVGLERVRTHRASRHRLFGACAAANESADEERASENDGETPHRRERHLALIARGV